MIDKAFYKEKTSYDYEDLLKIVHDLRQPDGCPWDRVQTWETLNTCLLDETYEVVNAVNNHDTENLREELGDVLLQVIMDAEIAKEQGVFTIEDVIDELCKKLVRRHPHVFAERSAGDAQEAVVSWEETKKKEKKGTRESAQNELQRVPAALPALMRAQKVLRKARGSGYPMPVFEEDPAASGNLGMALLKLVETAENADISAEKVLTETIETYIKDVSESESNVPRGGNNNE